ncbi:hypothetical protein B296_00014989 [Ensete ventricosum]|uniref:Peptidase A2 domain-containing protein n=1 Tax=Ensete ventricosum TaxID=4639 RepID=A0A427B235_ENSVE|nr:hypothetical protein B296_00014989 [Ensete ventricosum]
MERGEQTVPRSLDVPLDSTQTDIFLQIREKELLKTPNSLRSRAEVRDHRRYCHFHRNYGHDIEERYDLKNQIEDLIHRGHLDPYIRKSSSARKAYVCAEVPKRPRPRGDPGFTFEPESEYPYHDDVLVVTARIANACVRRIMIDTGSSTYILYLDSFNKLGMTNRDLDPMTSTLIGFTDDAITPVGVTTLPITFGDEPRTKTLMTYFMVVDLPSAYNVIIRRLNLKKLRAIVFTNHRSMKFLTRAG